jgi:replication factor C subunit 3/5
MQADEDGISAVCHLGRGDMRQTLNILQSVVLAHESVTQKDVYLCTGNPAPDVIEKIMNVLLNEDFRSAFGQLHKLQVRDLLHALYVTRRGSCSGNARMR